MVRGLSKRRIIDRALTGNSAWLENVPLRRETFKPELGACADSRPALRGRADRRSRVERNHGWPQQPSSSVPRWKRTRYQPGRRTSVPARWSDNWSVAVPRAASPFRDAGHSGEGSRCGSDSRPAPRRRPPFSVFRMPMCSPGAMITVKRPAEMRKPSGPNRGYRLPRLRKTGFRPLISPEPRDGQAAEVHRPPDIRQRSPSGVFRRWRGCPPGTPVDAAHRPAQTHARSSSDGSLFFGALARPN